MISGKGKTIAVVGATGRQGGQVARQLLRQGWKVRALTRKPATEKAVDLYIAGAEVVQADLEDKESLESAFANIYGVFHMQPPTLGQLDQEVRQGKNAGEAAIATGVRHVVFGSAGPGQEKTGVEQWDAKIEIADFMKNLGLPLTILRPMAFMELMTDASYYPQSSTWYIWPRLTGTERRIPWLSVQDLGVIAAQAFADPDAFIGKDLPLAADAKSLGECREIYREVKGKEPARFPMPMFLFEKFVGKDIPKMWRWLRDNPVSVEMGPTYKVHPEAMSVQAWLLNQ